MKEVALFNKENGLIGKINFESDMISLTDLWKAAGKVREKAPNFWLNQDSTKEFIDMAASLLNATQDCIIKTKRGKSGGSYAHKNIALAYAKYLDPKLHVLVNEIFFQRIEEEKNPDLIADRYVSTYKRKGKSDDWITNRFEGRIARNEYTSILASHDVQREGFRNCTNAIYGNLFGGSTAVIRAKKGLSRKDNIRDHCTSIELTAIRLTEQIASESIERNSLYGNAQCEVASRNASKAVGNAIVQGRKINNTSIL